MNKILFGKLQRELLMATLGTLLLTFVFFWAGRQLMYSGAGYVFSNTEFIEDATNRSVKRFQEYVTENGVASADKDKIRQWTHNKEPISLEVISDDVSFYYDGIITESMYTEADGVNQDYMTEYIYDIAFADKTVRIYYDGFYDYKVYSALSGLMIVLSLVFFIAVFTRLIKNKINYVARLESGIHILESGDLNYEIEVRGCDELTGLARSLNDMRVSLERQITAKEEAVEANRSLITALSHDLRTPLTTQTGYLEILKEGHYETREEHDRYVGKCLDNCRQLKMMSDRLFDYFMAFRREGEEACDMEIFDAGELFLQFIVENLFLLEEDGYRFEMEMPEQKTQVKANVEYLCRIFNNLASNLKKYAEKSESVLIAVKRQEESVMVSIQNRKKREPGRVESSKIGLENVKSLMKSQGGRAEVKQTEDVFTVKLFFPVV